MKLFDLDCPLERCVWAFWGIVGLLALVSWGLNTAYPEHQAEEVPNDPYIVLYPEFTPEQREELRVRHAERDRAEQARVNELLFKQATVGISEQEMIDCIQSRGGTGDLEESVRDR